MPETLEAEPKQIEEKPIEDKRPKQPILYGRKTILFPFHPSELDHFVKLHRDDKNGLMCRFCLKEMTEQEARDYITLMVQTQQVIAWTVQTKEGRASRRGGFIYLDGFTSFSTSVNGIMDNDFAKGLTKEMRRGKYTYAEDALRTMIGYLFREFKQLERVDANVLENNRRALRLDEKIGFKKEGVMRKGIKINGEFQNVIILSLLREEWKNGQQ